MRRVLRTLIDVARVVRRLSEAAATLAFGGLAALLAYTVWQRYVMGAPSRWSDELAMVVFLWIVFGAAALVVPHRDQIAVGLVSDSVSPGLRRWLTVAGSGLAGLILLATLPVTLDYIAFLWRERTPAMRLPLNKVYLVFGLFQGLVALGLILRAGLVLAGRPVPFDAPPSPAGRDGPT